MLRDFLYDFMSSVSFKPKPLSKRKGQSGQMAIFVALIFQVLFVFFAMAINIGLVVHDKINLQCKQMGGEPSC